MPTSDQVLGRAWLDRANSVGLPVALLHDPHIPETSRESTGDIDLAAGRPLTRRFLGALTASTLAPLGLSPVMMWPYDHDGLALFALSAAGEAGLHLDLVHGNRGHGRLGIRYLDMLANSRRNQGGWRHVSQVDELVYLLRKRHSKKQVPLLPPLIDRARGMSSEFDDRAYRVLVRAAHNDIRRLLHAPVPPVHLPRFSQTAATRGLNLLRLGRRIARPSGAWVHLIGDAGTVAQALATRLNRTLVLSRVIEPTPDWSTMMCAIAALRWRPGVAFTFGVPTTHTGRPDIELETLGRSTDDVARELVVALSARLGIVD